MSFVCSCFRNATVSCWALLTSGWALLLQVNSFFSYLARWHCYSFVSASLLARCFNFGLPSPVVMQMQFIKSNWFRRGQHVCGKTTIGCHSSCDMALSLLSHFLMAFCFLLPLFYACTHPFTASLCGQFDGISWPQVSSTPATGPGSSLCVDCLCLSLSISLNSSACANKAVSLFFI